MKLRFSTSDSYAGNRDNLSRTVSQFSDSSQIFQKHFTGDSFTFHPTTPQAKTTYNKVTGGQPLFFKNVAQATTAVQNFVRQIINYFLVRFIGRTCAHICVLVPAGAKESASRSSKTRAQKLFLIVLTLLPFFNYAQGKDSTQEKHKPEKIIFVSGGIGSIQYNNDDFFSYCFNKTYTPFYWSPDDKISSGSTIPSRFSYEKKYFFPILSAGIGLNSGRNRKINLNHIAEINYLKFSGEYFYNVSYTGYENSAPPNWTEVDDTVNNQYTHSILSFNYKIQPTYKNIFLSLGIISSLNLITVSQQRKEQINHWFYDEVTHQMIYSPTIKKNLDTSYDFNFLNETIQIGGGGLIKLKSIIFKPSFYFTPYLKKGYNIYYASLEILYKIN